MSPAVIAELLKLGLPGIVILALGYWVQRKDGEIRDLQAKYVEMVQSVVGVTTTSNLALEATRESLKEMKESFDEWTKKRGR